MFRPVLSLLAAVIAVAMFAVNPAHSEKRVALVLGNSDYKHTAPLANPKNDAADVAAVLLRLGFTVIEGTNLEKREMERKIRDYADALKGADVGLFYYAGHGIQVNGKNYLAPIDAELKSETDLDFEAIDLNLVLRQMERNSRVNLVFLDACRDNPLAQTLARSLGSRSRSVNIGRGLAPVEKAVGMMIAFATQPGNVALDGDGRNSPFTKALLNHIETAGATINDIMIDVRRDVISATNGKQVPWENSSLTGQFYFNPSAKVSGEHYGDGTKVANANPDGKAASKVSKTIPTTTFDHTFWTSIRDSNDPALFQEYLRRFPNGVFTPIATAKLEALKRDAKDKKTYGVDSGEKGKPARHAALEGPGTATAGTPEATPGAATPAPDIDPAVVKRQLAIDAQAALKRHGCYTSAIDGIWGRGSQAAMARFNATARTNLPVGAPDETTVNVLKSWRGAKCVHVVAPRSRSSGPKHAKRPPKKKKTAKKPGPAQSRTPPPSGGGGNVSIGIGGGGRGGLSIGIIGGGVRF
ncbi:MAG: hypothetical protein Kow0032_15200 [Methyloligellaceae bacterium]